MSINPKDIMQITGRSERYSRELLQKIRTDLGKNEHQFISVREFCSWAGLNYEEVRQILKN